MASWGQMMAFVRTTFGGDVARNGSLLKALVRRYGEPDVDVMIHGAALLGWTSLIGLNGKDGIGARWARAAYWERQKRAAWKAPERLKGILWDIANQ